MTRIKLCGLSKAEDIEAANALKPEYVGFVFAPGSRRRVTAEQAATLRHLLDPDIMAVGVFTDEKPEVIADLLRQGIIDIPQLHGREDGAYIRRLREHTEHHIIQAFRIAGPRDVSEAAASCADLVLLDSGTGSGRKFNWDLIRSIDRPYILAGGLDPGNVAEAVSCLRPYGVDVSSGIETGGRKDQEKMAAFIRAVRGASGDVGERSE